MRWMSALRKVNAIVSCCILVLFVLHGLTNSFLLALIGEPGSKLISFALVTLTVVHALIGVVLTVDAVRTARSTHAGYAALNARFWAVRVSGLMICVLIVLHMCQFLVTEDGPFRLRPFDLEDFCFAALLVLSILVHLVCNARPLAIALGIPEGRLRAQDLSVALGILCALMVAAFLYYLLVWTTGA